MRLKVMQVVLEPTRAHTLSFDDSIFSIILTKGAHGVDLCVEFGGVFSTFELELTSVVDFPRWSS